MEVHFKLENEAFCLGRNSLENLLGLITALQLLNENDQWKWMAGNWLIIYSYKAQNT